jgi:POT family proton-dependent oligopeptide transporter
MAAQTTGLDSNSLAINDVGPVDTISQGDPVSTENNKGIIPESYDLGVGDEDPNTDELHGPNALRRVSAPIPWVVYTVAFVELCERFSYYGTQVLCKRSTAPYKVT